MTNYTSSSRAGAEDGLEEGPRGISTGGATPKLTRSRRATAQLIKDQRKQLRKLLDTNYAPITTPNAEPAKVPAVSVHLNEEFKDRVIHIPMRRFSESEHEIVDEHIDKMLKQKMVEKSRSG